jgi:hypothetical protein
MYRYNLAMPDELADTLQRCARHLSVARDRQVTLLDVMLELFAVGLEAVKDEPGWKDALQKK